MPNTHALLDAELCGTPVVTAAGRAEVEFVATERMRADATGLVHGGFVFGLADHAAMLAIDAPTVVLGAAQSRFLAPVVVGDRVRAIAHLRDVVGKKHLVDVEVRRGEDLVLQASMTCFVPAQHVLAGRATEGDRARR
ncbi:MAG: hotdog domain-containing protein [Nannocystaceae bacterium]